MYDCFQAPHSLYSNGLSSCPNKFSIFSWVDKDTCLDENYACMINGPKISWTQKPLTRQMAPRHCSLWLWYEDLHKIGSRVWALDFFARFDAETPKPVTEYFVVPEDLGICYCTQHLLCNRNERASIIRYPGFPSPKHGSALSTWSQHLGLGVGTLSACYFTTKQLLPQVDLGSPSKYQNINITIRQRFHCCTAMRCSWYE